MVRLEFLIPRLNIKICAYLFITYDMYPTSMYFKSTKGFQIKEYTVIRS